MARQQIRGAQIASDVFVSYSDDGYALAQGLATFLTDHGLSVWVDRSALLEGSDWRRTAHEGLVGSAVLVAVVTASSLKSTWCADEIATAGCLAKRIVLYVPQGKEGFVVPTALRARAAAVSTSKGNIARAALQYVEAGRTQAWLENPSR